jgi:hypothetical protein
MRFVLGYRHRCPEPVASVPVASVDFSAPEWRGGTIDPATGQLAKPAPPPPPPPPADECCRRTVGLNGTRLHWRLCPVGLAEEDARLWYPLGGPTGRPSDRQAVISRG